VSQGEDLTETEEITRFLLCRIGSRIGALDLRYVGETLRPLPVEPLTGAPAFVLGLAILRGFPIPVVDVCRLLDSSAAFCTRPEARFVSIRLGERSAALAVDAVLEVRSLAAEILADIPPLLREAGAETVSVIGSLDSKLLLVLEAARLLPDSVWKSIEALEVSA
jgi:purine-binding chemotaxis protein CheW